MNTSKKIVIFTTMILTFSMAFLAIDGGINYSLPSQVTPSVALSEATLPSNYSFYHYIPANAVNYGLLVDSSYYHQKYYPSGINGTQMQKNLDYFSNSEDCAHFVSEALIAGGLTSLASNPPGDNLQGYDNGQFVGSYGIVGVYRLVDYLAGYVLPVFSTNATVEQTLQYQPVPASYQGSPLASVYYVTNDSMYPSYFLSPGDMIADGGVGAGHAMLYIGGGTVVQTDPAGKWQYAPGPLLGDMNISFYGMDTLNNQNVSSLYIHMPTFSSQHSVRITVLSNGAPLKDSSTFSLTEIPSGHSVTLIGSFPDGVGIGNYTYTWYDNGKLVSNDQVLNFSPYSGANDLELVSSGSNGSASTYFTFYSGSVPAGTYVLFHSGTNFITVYITYAAIIAAVVGGSSIYAVRRRKK